MVKYVRVFMVAALIAACDRTGSQVVGLRPGPAAGRATKAPPTLATVTSGPEATADPAAQGPDLLLPPKGASTLLSGKIALDANYVVAVGGGKLVSDSGGVLVQAKGGAVVSNNSGNVVNREHAEIIGHHGAGLVGKTKLVSDSGSGIISNNAGGLISNNGGGLVGKTKYIAPFGLLAATESPYRAAPAGGMLMAVLSLNDGAYLPLGVDNAGKPVYSAYTNTQGEFTVHLPEHVKDNVLIVSAVPGTTDPGLAVDAIVTPGGRVNLAVDDGTTVVTTYLRRSVVSRFAEVVDPTSCRPLRAHSSASGDGFTLATDRYSAELRSESFKGLSRAARERVLTRFADAAIARIDLDGTPILPFVQPNSKATGLAYPLLKRLLHEIEEAAAKHLATSPTYFDTRPSVKLANLNRGDLGPWRIRKPADFSEFLVTEYFTTNDHEAANRSESMFLDIGLDASYRDDILAGGGSLFATMIPVLTGPESSERLHAVLKEAIDEEVASPPTAPDAPCPAVPAPPLVEATVTTLAGTGESGFHNGAGATATFHNPRRLAVDPRGYLYISDNHRIRRIDLNDPTHPVSLVAGDDSGPAVDGPGATATFNNPSGLAVDRQGTLYVADCDNHCIRKITDPSGTPIVSTVAGNGIGAFADGPASAARFNGPEDVVLASDGSLFVADTKNCRIRRVAPDGTVTTFSGTGRNEILNGLRGEIAAFVQPRALALGSDGVLFVSDSRDKLIRMISPTGITSVLSGGAGPGVHDGTIDLATYDLPVGLALGSGGTLFITDAKSQTVRRLDPTSGYVGTFAGSVDQASFADGRGAAARFNKPEGIAVGPDGTVYVADTLNCRIRALRP